VEAGSARHGLVHDLRRSGRHRRRIVAGDESTEGRTCQEGASRRREEGREKSQQEGSQESSPQTGEESAGQEGGEAARAAAKKRAGATIPSFPLDASFVADGRDLSRPCRVAPGRFAYRSPTCSIDPLASRRSHCVNIFTAARGGAVNGVTI